MDSHAKAIELAKRPYSIRTSLDETTEGQPIYFARVSELDGCFGQGKTPEKAIADLRLAMIDFIESLLDDGLPVPDPVKLKLVEPTSSTAYQDSYFFIVKNNILSPQQNAVDQNAYFYLHK
jgi:predicted RNase H-like HicB family nuclease